MRAFHSTKLQEGDAGETNGNPKDDKQLNIFFGFDKEINRSFSFLFECDAGLNDNDDEYLIGDLTFGKGKGFVNAAFRTLDVK